MLRVTRSMLVGLVLAPLRVILAQDTTLVNPAPPPQPVTDTLSCGFCYRPNVLAAVVEGFLVNATVNRFNAWVRKDSTAKVTPHTWRYNFQHGWDWDKDNFVVNMLAHPYNGSVYFAAARSNGLSFWAGVPLNFFHSAVWEYFGETTQPSINDLVDTGLGGIALGEMFHRVAATIRNNQLGGGARFLRELAALPFDPVGSVNRLVSGEWGRRGPNPVEHNPVATVLRVGAGAGIVRAPGGFLTSLKDAKFSSALFADLKYGDSYIDSLRKPFDAFSARILLAPGHGGLTQLVGVGRVTLTAGLEHAGVPYLTLHYQPAWIHTINGADANHFTTFAAVEGSIPLLDQLALVIHGTYYDRLSRYADGTRNHRRFPEIRVFAAFKTAHRPAGAQ